MLPMIVFDDGRAQLGPMADLRAAFEIRTGMYTTAGRIAAHRPRALVGYWVPQRLLALVAERANAPVNQLPNDEVILCINGRWAMPTTELAVEQGEAVIEQSSGHVVATVLRRSDADYFLTTGDLPERVRHRTLDSRVLYRFPWDVIGLIKQTIPHDILAVRMSEPKGDMEGAATVGDYPLQVHRSARVYPGVVFDAEHGPIWVHERAVIRPGAVLCGPCSVGHDSTVLDRAIIKANTVIGPWCKVAGEVGATIFQGYANKSHDGHLGDSWVGKWANLGAGTTNSNLLNTYGEVTMRLDADSPRQRTGMQFLGAIIGDHVKTAICTRLMTGTILGTGAMIASTSPPSTTVRRFAWLTEEGERTYRWEKFLDVARTVMARRNETITPAYEALMHDVHAGAVEMAGG